MMNATSLLVTVAFAVLLDDSQTLESGDALRTAYLSELPHSVMYSTMPSPGHYIETCWDKACAALPTSSSCRLEAAFACTLEKFAGAQREQQGEQAPNWFVFTAPGVYWSSEGLAKELVRLETVLAPGRPEEDVLLVGGGGLMIFSYFMILSRPALELLADASFMRECRARLLSCDPSNKKGCKFKTNSKEGGVLYTSNELVHFCLAEPLRKGPCGAKGGGCEYMFGRLVNGGESVGATAARRRFVSNAGKKGPSDSVKQVLKLVEARRQITGRAREGSAGEGSGSMGAIIPTEADPCALAEAYREFVAFANADNAALEWLCALQKRARLCRRRTKI